MKTSFNFGFAIASVVLALALWTYVKSEAALTKTSMANVPLKVIGLDQEHFTARGVPPTVAAQISGTAEAIEQYRALKVGGAYATVDLSDAKPELSNYRVRLTSPSLVQRMGVSLSLTSDEIAIIVEAQKDQKMPVMVDPYNTPAGLVFASAQISPDQVVVRGTQRQLDLVGKVRARVDLSQAIGRGITVALEVLDKQEHPIENEDVQVIPREVVVYPTLGKVAPTKSALVSVVLASGTKPALGYRLVEIQAIPATVTVSGEMNQLASLKSLQTVPVSLDGLDRDSTIRARLVVPRGIGIDPHSRPYVDVRVKIEPIPGIANPPTGSTGGTP